MKKRSRELRQASKSGLVSRLFGNEWPANRAHRSHLPETLENRLLFSVFTVTNNGDAGAGTLRQAIASADLTPGSTINFNLPATQLVIHVVNQGLPAITAPTTINGATQPGFSNATPTPVVTIDGSNTFGDGLDIESTGVTVRGLTFTRFSDVPCILVGGTGANTIVGNVITGNKESGIDVVSDHNMIGGFTAANRNVINGSNVWGINNTGNGNQIIGNYIGTNTLGNTAAQNFVGGIQVVGASTFIYGNIISGNGYAGGIHLAAGAVGTVIQDNAIGVNADGVTNLGNRGNGVTVEATTDNANVTIGGPAAGSGNTIAFNSGTGVVVAEGFGTTIERNSIYSNAGGAIELDGNANSSPFGPVITSAQLTTGNTTEVTGTLTGAANTTFRIELFHGGAAAPVKTFLGFVNITTDASGQGTFQAVGLPAIPQGDYVGGTATDPAGNTSAVTNDFQVTTATGAIGGNVYFDVNENHQQDAGEIGLPGQQVSLVDSLGFAVATTTTGENGIYLFTDLAPDTYTVHYDIPDGPYHQTTPYNNNDQVVTVGSTGVGGIQFGVASGPAGDIYGRVFSADQGVGTRQQATPAPGQHLWLDFSPNTSYVYGDPTTITDTSGNYVFKTATAGDYFVHLYVPPGFAATDGISAQPVSLARGQQVINIDFGLKTDVPVLTGLRGTVFFDRNNNGIEDPDEGGLPGVQVYVDINHTGVYTPGDPTTTTDTLGNYAIGSLNGQYVVRVVPPGGYDSPAADASSQTVNVFPGQAVAPANFGLNFIGF